MRTALRCQYPHPFALLPLFRMPTAWSHYSSLPLGWSPKGDQPVPPSVAEGEKERGIHERLPNTSKSLHVTNLPHSRTIPEKVLSNLSQQRGPIQHISLPGIQMTFSLPLTATPHSGPTHRDSRTSTPTPKHSRPPRLSTNVKKMAHVFHDLSTSHFSPAQAYPSPTAPYQEAGEKGSDSEEEHEEVINLSDWVPLLDLTHASPYGPASSAA